MIRSLLWLTPSPATLPQASAVRVFCISAHLLSKSFSFKLFSLSLPVFSLSLYHSVFVILKDVLTSCNFLVHMMYLCLCGIGVMLCGCIGSKRMFYHCLYVWTEVHYRSNFSFCLRASTAFGSRPT